LTSSSVIKKLLGVANSLATVMHLIVENVPEQAFLVVNLVELKEKRQGD